MGLVQLWTTTLLEIKKIVHDRRRTAILILGPVLLCLVFGLVAYYDPREIDVAIFVDHAAAGSANLAQTQQLIDSIRQSDTFKLEETSSLDEALSRLEKGLLRAVITFREGQEEVQKIEVTVDATDQMIQRTVSEKLTVILAEASQQRALQQMGSSGLSQAAAASIITPYELSFATNETRPVTTKDLSGSAVVVLFVVGISVILSSFAVTSERSRGTIERIFASPYRRWVFVSSKVLANSLFGIAIAFLVWLTLRLAFGIVPTGNIGLVLLLTVLTSFNAIAMGLLVSAVTYTELESILGGTMLWFMTMLTMGIVWPLETMHPVFTYVARLMPFTYALHSLRNVSLIGWEFADILPDVLVLTGSTVAVAMLATFALRRRIK